MNIEEAIERLDNKIFNFELSKKISNVEKMDKKGVLESEAIKLVLSDREEQIKDKEWFKRLVNKNAENTKKYYISKDKIKEIYNEMIQEHDTAISEFVNRKELNRACASGDVAQELGYFIGKLKTVLKEGE